jgi:hypothetical protein
MRLCLTSIAIHSQMWKSAARRGAASRNSAEGKRGTPEPTERAKSGGLPDILG